jgi:hypothetical protein
MHLHPEEGDDLVRIEPKQRRKKSSRLSITRCGRSDISGKLETVLDQSPIEFPQGNIPSLRTL